MTTLIGTAEIEAHCASNGKTKTIKSVKLMHDFGLIELKTTRSRRLQVDSLDLDRALEALDLGMMQDQSDNPGRLGRPATKAALAGLLTLCAKVLSKKTTGLFSPEQEAADLLRPAIRQRFARHILNRERARLKAATPQLGLDFGVPS